MPYQTMGSIGGNWQGSESLRPNLENNRVYKIRVFFEDGIATITDHAIMQDDSVKRLADMTDDEIIDMLKAASTLGDELEKLGYVVNR